MADEWRLIHDAMQIVWRVYRAELQRDPDPDCAGWVAEIATGHLDEPGMIAAVRTTDEWAALHQEPAVPVPPQEPTPTPQPGPTLSRLSVRDGALWHGPFAFQVRCVSEFSLFYHESRGNTAEVERRLNRCRDKGANVVRVLSMARYLFDLPKPDWGAMSRVVRKAAALGLRAEVVLFADAQELCPSHGDRQRLVSFFAEWCNEHDSIIPQLANEPFKNGWASAVDPALLELAAQFDRESEHDFSVGDPCDTVEDPATGAPLKPMLETLAQRSSILVLHAERKGRDGRYAGWVDHLKGFDEVYSNPLRRYRWHDEPMGAASTYQDGRRDDRPDAHLAAMLVSAVMGIGYTYHYISEQDDATPGLDGFRVASQVSADPSYRFKNAGTTGAVVEKFDGFDKVRTTDNGSDGWAVGYGHKKGQLVLRTGWAADVVHETDHVVLWRTRKA